MRGKFKVPPDPLQVEATLTSIAPSDEYLDKQILHMANTQLASSSDPAKQVAAGLIVAQVKQKQFSSAVGQAFLHKFHLFLLGRLTDEKDLDNTQYGQQPLYDDPEVRAYLESFVIARTRFKIALARLDMTVPKGIYQWYLYFKYRVCRADSSEYMKDFEMFERAFDDAGKNGQEINDPKHPWHPRPYPPYDESRNKTGDDSDGDSDDDEPPPPPRGPLHPAPPKPPPSTKPKPPPSLPQPPPPQPPPPPPPDMGPVVEELREHRRVAEKTHDMIGQFINRPPPPPPPDMGAVLTEHRAQIGDMHKAFLEHLTQTTGQQPPHPPAPPGAAVQEPVTVPDIGAILAEHRAQMAAAHKAFLDHLTLAQFSGRYPPAPPGDAVPVEQGQMQLLAAHNQQLQQTIDDMRRNPPPPDPALVAHVQQLGAHNQQLQQAVEQMRNAPAPQPANDPALVAHVQQLTAQNEQLKEAVERIRQSPAPTSDEDARLVKARLNNLAADHEQLKDEKEQLAAQLEATRQASERAAQQQQREIDALKAQKLIAPPAPVVAPQGPSARELALAGQNEQIRAELERTRQAHEQQQAARLRAEQEAQRLAADTVALRLEAENAKRATPPPVVQPPVTAPSVSAPSAPPVASAPPPAVVEPSVAAAPAPSVSLPPPAPVAAKPEVKIYEPTPPRPGYIDPFQVGGDVPPPSPAKAVDAPPKQQVPLRTGADVFADTEAAAAEKAASSAVRKAKKRQAQRFADANPRVTRTATGAPVGLAPDDAAERTRQENIGKAIDRMERSESRRKKEEGMTDEEKAERTRRRRERKGTGIKRGPRQTNEEAAKIFKSFLETAPASSAEPGRKKTKGEKQPATAEQVRNAVGEYMVAAKLDPNDDHVAAIRPDVEDFVTRHNTHDVDRAAEYAFDRSRAAAGAAQDLAEQHGLSALQHRDLFHHLTNEGLQNGDIGHEELASRGLKYLKQQHKGKRTKKKN